MQCEAGRLNKIIQKRNGRRNEVKHLPEGNTKRLKDQLKEKPELFVGRWSLCGREPL